MLSWLAFAGLAKRVITGVITFLGRLNLAQLGCLALGLLLIVQHFQLLDARHDRDSWHKQFTSEHNARKADQDAYRKAQAEAATENKAQVAKVEQQYQRNSDNEREAYLRDLAKLRADRVRRQDSAPQGSTGPTVTPEDAAGTPRINGDGVCVPASSDVCEAGAEIELRLMHLQDLYEQQVETDPNK